MLLVASALSFIYVPTLGRIYVSEVILALYLVHCIAQRRRFPRWLRGLVVLAFMWLLCQLASDIYNHIALIQSIRSLANILVLVVDMAALSMLLERERDVRATGLTLGLGLAIAGLGTVLLGSDVNAQVDPWKFGIAYPVTLLVAAMSIRLRRAAAIPMLLLSGVHLALDFRSLGAICLLSSAITLLAHRMFPHEDASQQARHRVSTFLVVAASALAILFASHAYDFAAGHGWLGKVASEKYDYQAHGRYGVLGGGRSDIYFSSLAVQQRPLIGYGSEPRMTAQLAIRGLGRLYADGYRLPPYAVADIVTSPNIPSHSFVMGAWVQAGIGGLLFWIGVISLVVRLFVGLVKRGRVADCLVIIAFANTLWNILFSPLSGPSRLSFAVTFGILALASTVSQGETARLGGPSE